jgi:hypothetical protein
MAVADRTHTALEAALHDVHATLVDVLAAADEQYAAVVAGDRIGLEAITQRQERLSTRLGRAEATRLDLLRGASLNDVLATLPAERTASLSTTAELIRAQVEEVRARHARTADLLRKGAELAAQTVQFLQKLATAQAESYSPTGSRVAGQSLLVDSRA